MLKQLTLRFQLGFVNQSGGSRRELTTNSSLFKPHAGQTITKSVFSKAESSKSHSF